MVVRGTKKYGISLVYKWPGPIRFTNLSEREAKETIRDFGWPNDITTSRKNKRSNAKDTLEHAKKLADRMRAEISFLQENEWII